MGKQKRSRAIIPKKVKLNGSILLSTVLLLALLFSCLQFLLSDVKGAREFVSKEKEMSLTKEITHLVRYKLQHEDKNLRKFQFEEGRCVVVFDEEIPSQITFTIWLNQDTTPRIFKEYYKK